MTKNKLKVNYLLFVIILFSCYALISAQGFRGIIPLKSNCDDVKRVLKVEKCTVPFSLYYLKDFTVSIHFTKEKASESDKICYKVPAGKVSSVTVSYNKPFLIKDFEYAVKYSEGPFGDIFTIAYDNPDKGVAVFTNDGFIKTAFFIPTRRQHQKFYYECRESSSR